MKRAVIGSKIRFYDLIWEVSDSKRKLSETVKQMKVIDSSNNFYLNVKGRRTDSGKKSVNTTTAIRTKEDREDLKSDMSAGALCLGAFYKIMRKPDNINFADHTIKERVGASERKFESGVDVTAKNWILMFSAEDRDTNENGYWIAVIKEGEPWLFNFDTFISEHQSYEKQGTIVDEISKMITSDDERSKEYAFISDRKDILEKFETFFYNSESTNEKIFESITIGFDSLIEGIKQPNIEKIHSTAIKPQYIAIAVALGLVGFGVNYVIGYMNDQAEAQKSIIDKENAQKSKAENIKLQEKYEAEKKKYMIDTLEKAKQELNNTITTGQPKQTLSAISNDVSSIKVNQNGWSLSKIDCSVVKNKDNCELSLQKTTFGLNKTLLDNYPNAKIVNDKASYSVISDKEIVYPNLDYQLLPTPQKFLYNTMSKLQELNIVGISYSTGAFQEITQAVNLPKPPSKLIKQNMKVDPIKMGVAIGTIKVTGTGLFMLNGLENWLNDNSLKVTKVTLNVDKTGNVGWVVLGNYFVKTADTPVMPKVEPSKLGV